MQEMKIDVAADHAGFALKQQVLEYLKSKGLEVEGCGPPTCVRSLTRGFLHRSPEAATRAAYRKSELLTNAIIRRGNNEPYPSFARG